MIMKLNKIVATVGSMAFLLSFTVAHAAAPLTTSCVGAPSSSSITWTASSTGGVAPVTYLWGNANTLSVQTVSVSPGSYSMTLQTTDASSTIATAICSATVLGPAPIVSSFTANPTSITSGQSAVLSWAVSNASTTSLNNGIGAIVGTSVTVSPTVTTTYQLSAVNPGGTTNASATVTVIATTTNPALAEQIKNLRLQIASLTAQLAGLLIQQQRETLPPPQGTCAEFRRNLRHGDRGDDVRRLQKELALDPSIFGSDLATGFFGKQTEEALKKYQKKFGIFSVGSTTTGFFGTTTRGFLKEHCGDNGRDHDKKNKNEKHGERDDD
jgi:hypothetical protein